MDDRVRTIIEKMNQALSDTFSISMLARSVNLSSTRLRQLFLKETGQSPIRYLKGLRIKKAKLLLQSSFLSIKEIAFQAGLGDVSHFSRDFKKQYGLTPSEYRTQNRTDVSNFTSGDE
jgi:AraC family transcriptional activator of mtrCDE